MRLRPGAAAVPGTIEEHLSVFMVRPEQVEVVLVQEELAPKKGADLRDLLPRSALIPRRKNGRRSASLVIRLRAEEVM